MAETKKTFTLRTVVQVVPFFAAPLISTIISSPRCFVGVPCHPVLLDSTWAFFPALLLEGGFIQQTALEDKPLQEELPGYNKFARKIRYRLLPGIW